MFIFVLLSLLCCFYNSKLIQMHDHISIARHDHLLQLHSDIEDFTASTWIIYINTSLSLDNSIIVVDWNNENTYPTIIQSFLDKDHCKLLNSTIGDTQIMFKVYCDDEEEEEEEKESRKKKKRDDDPKEVLRNTLNDFLYKIFKKEAIHVENNKEFRRPHFYYGTYDILDYAIRLDAGTLNDNSKIQEIKVPNDKTFEKIRQNNFVETPAPWDLDRIDQHVGILDNIYQYENTASDIDVYVIDTGIRVTHNEFQGRAIFLINTVGDGQNTDCAGIFILFIYLY